MKTSVSIRPCGIFPGKGDSRLLRVGFDDLPGDDPAKVNHAMIRSGFRRERENYVAERCAACEACRPMRLSVRHFAPTGSQKKILKINRDVAAVFDPDYDPDEHHALFYKHRTSRNLEANESILSRDNFLQLADNEYLPFSVMEARLGGRLIGASLFDRMPDAISGAHYYYDTDLPSRSLGIYLLLQLVRHAADRGAAHLYLGQTTGEPSRLSYKNAFGPVRQIMNRDRSWTAPEP